MKLLSKELLRERDLPGVIDAVESGYFDYEDYKVSAKKYIGVTIKDGYCNGFFGRDMDLEGAVITEIVPYDYCGKSDGFKVGIRKVDGTFCDAIFTGEWSIWVTVESYLKEWTGIK